MKKSWRRRFNLSSDTKSLLAVLLLLAGLFTIAVILPLYLTAIDSPSATVVSSEDMGRLQSARFIDRFIRRETEIETDKGVFLVRGAFMARKGHPLVLELRDDGARMLCDPAQEICGRLAEE